MSLRLRLTAIAVGLVGLGLLAAGLAAGSYLRTFLTDGLDTQLPTTAGSVYGSLDPARPGPPPRTYSLTDEGFPDDTWVTLVWPGRASRTVTNDRDRDAVPTGVLPARPGFSTIGATRVLSLDARALDRNAAAGARLVVSMPLEPVDRTLDRLRTIELIAGAVVVAISGLLALILVGVGLRPLRRIEATAAAIAAGDLSRRVEQAGSRTEVGRLGRALNAMLSQIERAFAERRASEERLRRFVGDASHELRTPLTSLRGYAELFRRGAAQDPADLALAMARIEAEAARMGVIVDDLLQLAQLDQGVPLAGEPVDLGALVSDMVSDLQTLHPQWPADLTVEGEVVVRGDDPRLRQAVSNLLTNARTHTPAGTPIHVRVRRRGTEIAVEVADEGPGIDADHVQRLFERFFRADPSRSRRSGGSGLGLAIVASIAEAHGGRAEVESEPGRGATFRIVLPVGAPRAGG